MTRRLLTLASLLSLVLCLATAALWVRSYWVGDSISHVNAYSLWSLESSLGRIQCWHMRSADGRFEGSGLWRTSGPPQELAASQNIFPTVKTRLGFAYADSNDGAVSYALWVILIPVLMLGFLAGALPAMAKAWRRFALPPAAAAPCARCGYDLRATPGRCPECDAIPAEAKA
jgi:hypothetical protein